MPNTSNDAIQFLYFSAAFEGRSLQFITQSDSSKGDILDAGTPPSRRSLLVSLMAAISSVVQPSASGSASESEANEVKVASEAMSYE
jgi:hypothetical protein